MLVLRFFVVLLFLCSISAFTDEDLVTSLAEYLRNTETGSKTYHEPQLISKNTIEPNLYEIDANFKVKCDNEQCTSDAIKCRTKIKDVGDSLQVLNDETYCQDVASESSSEAVVITQPIELVYEVLLNDQYAGSGEQFIAIRRDSVPSGDWCAGCPTDISVNAEGVQELADSAIIHLNRHKPNSKHTLRQIVRVQRQAQIVNGVRYILLLEVDTSACENAEKNVDAEQTNEVTQTCLCQVVFLEKPWLRLANGNKFRAVLSNNCTDEYIFGDEGEIVTPNKQESTDGNFDDVYKVVHRNELNAVNQPNRNNQELTSDQVKDVESQIVTDAKEFEETGYSSTNRESADPEIIVRKQTGEQAAVRDIYDVTIEPVNRTPVVETDESAVISDDRRHALEGFLDFFGFDQLPMPLQTKETAVSNQADYQKSMTTKRSAENDSSPENDSSDEDGSQEKIDAPLSRSRRSTDFTDQNELEKQNIHRLAKFALETLDDYDADDSKRVILQILSSKTTKKGSSTNYFIKMRTGVSKCVESSENENLCSSMLLDDKMKICNVQVEVNANGESKVVKSNCMKESEQLKRNKRANRQLAGGVRDVDVTDAKIITLADESMNHYNLYSTHANKHKIINILSATRQVVEGSLTKIKFEVKETTCSKNDVRSLHLCEFKDEAESKTCSASIWDRPWLPDGKEIKINCKESDKSSRTKRGTKYESIPGAAKKIDIKNKDVISLAEESLGHYDMYSSHPNIHKIVNILSATRQVVSGIMTKIIFEVKETLCSKNDIKSFDGCEFKEDVDSKICTASVWNRPWLKEDGKKISIDCEESPKLSRSKRSKVGGIKEVDTNDETIVALAKESLNHFDLNSSHDNKHKIVNILTASKQIVSGVMTRITFEVKETTCLKNANDDPELCSFKKGAVVKRCSASVWDKPWLANAKQITVDCKEPLARSKRQTDEIERDIEAELVENVKSVFLDQKLFDKFIKKYSRTYHNDPVEYEKRFLIFRENLRKIDELNDNERGTAKYGPNIFADISTEEFRKRYLGLRPDLRLHNAVPMMKAVTPDIEDIPESFDWRDKGAVTPVKNQESCGSCWAFSVTGNIEGQYEIKYGKLLSLSEQELVDCDKLDDGCNGGLPDNAYRAIEQLGGLELETDYPYDAEDEKCNFNKSLAKVQISGAVNISSDEVDMQKWLLQNGPISIGINANAMQFYMGGISHPFKFLCSPDNLDHGVLIVGYGIRRYPLFNKTLPYWIIKNSWGESWGERGYYRVFRGDGTCGVNQMASSAVL